MKRMMRIMAGVTLSAFLLMTCSCSRFTSETSKTTVTSDSEQVTDISSGPEEKEISDTGVTLKSVLDLAKISSDEISSVKVVSSDEYQRVVHERNGLESRDTL